MFPWGKEKDSNFQWGNLTETNFNLFESALSDDGFDAKESRKAPHSGSRYRSLLPSFSSGFRQSIQL